MKKPTRRDLLRWSLFGSGGVALQSLATGLPPSFLRTGSVAHAQSSVSPTYLVVATSSAGDPLNANCPGSYPAPGDANDPRALVEHATGDELGTGSLGTVGGFDYSGADFESGHLCRLGDEDTWAARPWAELPEGLRSRMAVIRHRTYTNAHPEYRNVSEFHGSVKGPGRIGIESIHSMIAQETAGALGTVMEKPMSLGGPRVLFRGSPLRSQSPDSLFDLFAEGGVWRGLEPAEFARYRDAALDAIYADVKATGTHAQRRFFEENARSREDAMVLSDVLGASLAPIGTSDDPVEKQVLAVAALFEHNVCPVATIRLPFGGDNHQDSNLEDEVSETLAGIEGIRRLWEECSARGLADKVTFAYLGVFGRTLQRSSSGGRNHYGDDHAMVMFGPHVTPGLQGGIIDTGSNKRPLKAGPIGDIPVEETLAAAGKTLARAVGVPDDIAEERILGGRALF